MTTHSDEPMEDPWLTLSEIADELRLRPVTIRSWISKGKLRATRAGQRKWLVRRSDLDAMLADDSAPRPQQTADAGPDSYPDHVVRQMVAAAAEHEQTERELDLAVANYDWDIALEQSRMAPPDARFTARIRHIAHAADQQAAAIREAMAQPDFAWTPAPGSAGIPLSYELRPGGNRPGAKDAWDRVDRVVARLGEALEGMSAASVASVFGDLSRALNDVADAIENRALRAAEAADGTARDAEDPET